MSLNLKVGALKVNMHDSNRRESQAKNNCVERTQGELSSVNLFCMRLIWKSIQIVLLRSI
jgi:hypothetical protein